jgi:hypothetical protein
VLLVSGWFVFWRWPLGAFSRFSDLFNGLDGNLKLSGLVPTPHIGVEALNSMFFLEGSDLFREMEEIAPLSEIACDLEQLDFTHG